LKSHNKTEAGLIFTSEHRNVDQAFSKAPASMNSLTHFQSKTTHLKNWTSLNCQLKFFITPLLLSKTWM